MQKKRGFTLIELLVVIAIIALMLSVLMPALKEVKERGKRAVCMSNLRQLSLAYIMYAQLYNGRFVPVEIWDGELANRARANYEITLPDGRTEYAQPTWCFNKPFLKLLDQRGAENAGFELDSNPFDYFGLPPKFRCPSYPRKKAEEAQGVGSTTIIRTSYAPNMTDWARVDEEFGEGSPEEISMQNRIWNKGVLVEDIKRPAGKVLFTDAADVYLTYTWDQGNYINHWDEHGEIGWDYSDGGEHGPEPMYRHSEGANIAFCDGHVEYRKKNEMFYFLDSNKPNAAATNVGIARNDKLWCYFK